LPGSPWHEAARLAAGDVGLGPVTWLALWIVAANVLARRQFGKALLEDELTRDGSSKPVTQRKSRLSALFELPSRLFKDPVAALIEKEIRSLLRMPRFR